MMPIRVCVILTLHLGACAAPPSTSPSTAGRPLRGDPVSAARVTRPASTVVAPLEPPILESVTAPLWADQGLDGLALTTVDPTLAATFNAAGLSAAGNLLSAQDSTDSTGDWQGLLNAAARGVSHNISLGLGCPAAALAPSLVGTFATSLQENDALSIASDLSATCASNSSSRQAIGEDFAGPSLTEEGAGPHIFTTPLSAVMTLAQREALADDPTMGGRGWFFFDLSALQNPPMLALAAWSLACFQSPAILSHGGQPLVIHGVTLSANGLAGLQSTCSSGASPATLQTLTLYGVQAQSLSAGLVLPTHLSGWTGYLDPQGYIDPLPADDLGARLAVVVDAGEQLDATNAVSLSSFE